MLDAFAAQAEPEFTLRFHHFLGPKSPAQVKMIEPWAKRIEEASKGRIKIDIYPSMSLGGKPPELIRQARDGVVDIIWTVNGYTAGLFPRSEVFELPFIHTNDPAATNLAMAEMYEKYLADEYKGVKPLFLHVHAGQAIHMVDTPVTSRRIWRARRSASRPAPAHGCSKRSGPIRSACRCRSCRRRCPRRWSTAR